MKIVLEDIKRLAGSSFRILVNPKLNDFYYWHFHPEYELTYIVAQNGTRRVGNHVGNFEGSDLVFIGSNIPHLNFDYGIKTEYQKVVLQISEDFFKNDPETWYAPPRAEMQMKELTNSGMVEVYNHQYQWDNRQMQKVYDAFVDIWGTEKLWVTIDRANLNLQNLVLLMDTRFY